MGGWTLSQETKNRKSKVMKKWWEKNKNSRKVKERNKKISRILKGRIFPEDWKKKISEGVVKQRERKICPIKNLDIVGRKL